MDGPLLLSFPTPLSTKPDGEMGMNLRLKSPDALLNLNRLSCG